MQTVDILNMTALVMVINGLAKVPRIGFVEQPPLAVTSPVPPRVGHPTDPTIPIDPTTPIDPIDPIGPIGPLEPADPIKPPDFSDPRFP